MVLVLHVGQLRAQRAVAQPLLVQLPLHSSTNPCSCDCTCSPCSSLIFAMLPSNHDVALPSRGVPNNTWTHPSPTILEAQRQQQARPFRIWNSDTVGTLRPKWYNPEGLVFDRDRLYAHQGWQITPAGRGWCSQFAPAEAWPAPARP